MMKTIPRLSDRQPRALNAMENPTVDFFLPDYTVVVKTGDDWNAGTDAQVKIRVHGTLGNIREREIKGVFEKGR